MKRSIKDIHFSVDVVAEKHRSCHSPDLRNVSCKYWLRCQCGELTELQLMRSVEVLLRNCERRECSVSRLAMKERSTSSNAHILLIASEPVSLQSSSLSWPLSIVESGRRTSLFLHLFTQHLSFLWILIALHDASCGRFGVCSNASCRTIEYHLFSTHLYAKASEPE